MIAERATDIDLDASAMEILHSMHRQLTATGFDYRISQ